jgi:pimeloyl-ACP methyl ester carboxylesterase
MTEPTVITRRAAVQLTAGGGMVLATEGVSMADTDKATEATRYDGIRFRRATIEGVGINYQEAGDHSRPHLVLLHGFPSTSRMWDRLIPTLATRYHVIAPDYPGFGLSDAPATFAYTFDHIAQMMAALIRQLGIVRYSLLMQDYGGPIGFRMAMADEKNIETIIAQNAAAYEVALGPIWDARKAFWKDPESNREKLKTALLSLEVARTRHIGSSPRTDLYDPNSWNDEFVMLNRPGAGEIQTTLFYDYRNNVAAYPRWQAWLRAAKPRMQVVWGKYDTSFLVEGAAGYGRDNPNCETHIIEASHFPLDEAPDTVRGLHMQFLAKYLG